MKINKFLIAGAAVAALSFGAHAQEAPTQQQEINPTVAKTLNTVGGFFGALAQSAKAVVDTTAHGVKTIANSEGAQNIKSGVVKGAKVVSETASDIANSEAGQAVKKTANDIASSEAGQTVKDTTVKGAKFVSNTATDGARAVAKGYKEVTTEKTNVEPTVEAASVTPVTQPAATPSLAEGVEVAKNKIGSMISFLRDKATTNNSKDVDTPKVQP